MRQNQTLPAWSSAMPYGLPEVRYSTILPVFISRRPILFAPCIVNQIVPRSSVTSVCGSPPVGARYCVTLPVAGSSRHDGAVAVTRVPDDSFAVDQQSVRVRAGRKIPLVELLRPGIEARDPVAVHDRDIDVSVRTRRRVARKLRCRHRPFRNLVLEVRRGARRDGVVGTAGDRRRRGG
jgi:hypothetical protein